MGPTTYTNSYGRLGSGSTSTTDNQKATPSGSAQKDGDRGRRSGSRMRELPIVAAGIDAVKKLDCKKLRKKGAGASGERDGNTGAARDNSGTEKEFTDHGCTRAIQVPAETGVIDMEDLPTDCPFRKSRACGCVPGKTWCKHP